MKEKQFHQYWPLVDSFWIADGENVTKETTTRYYMCRLHKSKESSYAKKILDESNIPSHRRQGNFQAEGCCSIQLKIVEHTTEPTLFVVDRVSSEHNHNHSIDEACAAKSSTFLHDIVVGEFKKGYSAAIVLKQLRGSGMLGGRDLFDSIGGAFLTT